MYHSVYSLSLYTLKLNIFVFYNVILDKDNTIHILAACVIIYVYNVRKKKYMYNF